MTPINSPLQINVGFVTQQSAGFRRDFLVELDKLSLPPDLELHDFRMELAVTRTPQGLLTAAEIRSGVALECVRCLDLFQQPLKASFAELYAFTDRSLSEAGLMYPNSGLIDFSPLVREYVILEIPISPVCKPDCQGLCPICGENRNRTDCGHDEENNDLPFNSLSAYIGHAVAV